MVEHYRQRQQLHQGQLTSYLRLLILEKIVKQLQTRENPPFLANPITIDDDPNKQRGLISTHQTFNKSSNEE